MSNADFVIIGGGSAGSALAGRLLRNTDATVTIIEAGGLDDHWLFSLPAGFAKLMPTDNLFHFRTEPQDGLDGRARILPQGRVLGGGSSVNAMVYIRGQAQDFDTWEEMGAHGWGYRDVLPYFRRAEANERYANEYHGAEGPLGVSDLRHVDPMSRAFLRSAQEAGYPYNPDFNGQAQEGVGLCQTTTRDNKRSSASVAYLRAYRKDRRLKIITKAMVSRIMLSGTRAVGVEYVRDGRTEQVLAGREVVVSAGAIQTPKLLMLSGVGPAADLARHGITATVNLPGVGKNFQDHCEVPAIAFCRPGEAYGYFGQDKGLNQIRNGLQYMLFGSGPVASNVVEGHCFCSSGVSGPRADLQMQFLPMVYLDLLDRPVIQKAGATINTCVTRPYSRGYVALRSTNPAAFPILQPNFLQDERDVDATLRGLDMAREILAQKSLRAFVGEEAMPGLGITDRETLHRFIREYGKTVYHPSGTCRMGNDEMSVVDPELRVHGIDGLRVVDNSIMPTLTSGNTNAPAIMIGEKAADLLAGNANRDPVLAA